MHRLRSAAQASARRSASKEQSATRPTLSVEQAGRRGASFEIPGVDAVPAEDCERGHANQAFELGPPPTRVDKSVLPRPHAPAKRPGAASVTRGAQTLAAAATAAGVGSPTEKWERTH